MVAARQPWVLVTGNGAFGETAARKELSYAENPSSAVALSLHDEEILGHRIVSTSLDWHEHPREALIPLLSVEHAPAAVISLGVFSGRSTISVERIAANVQDFQFPSNDFRPAGIPVEDNGPAAYFSTLPIKAIARDIRAAGIPALVSNTASTHGCNSVMYTALHFAASEGIDLNAGFIHLPDPPAHVAALGSNGPSMSLQLQQAAIRIAIAATISHKNNDIEVPANEWEW